MFLTDQQTVVQNRSRLYKATHKIANNWRQP